MSNETEPKYYTPKAALDAIAGDRPLDAVLANPKFGELPDGVKLTPLAERHMSIPEASGILMELARKRSMSIDQVNALEMAVRRLMNRHFPEAAQLGEKAGKTASGRQQGRRAALVRG